MNRWQQLLGAILLILVVFGGIATYQIINENKACNKMNDTEFESWIEKEYWSYNISQKAYCDNRNYIANK